MSDNKFVLLDTRHQVKEMLDYLTHIQQQQPLVGLVVPSKGQALNMVQTIIAEMMEGINKNIKSGTDWDVVRASILYGMVPAQVLHRQVKFVERIFDHPLIHTMYDDLRRQVSAHEKYTSYNTWEVMNTGSMIGLYDAGDQRILNWEMLEDAQEDKYVTLDLTRVYEAVLEQFVKNFGPYPESQVDTMIIETVLGMFPQLKRVDKRQEVVNYDMAAAYGVPNLADWIDQYIRSVLTTFNVPAFGQYIEPGVTYECNYVLHRLTIREHKEETVEVDSDADLAKQLLRGDYLPREERERAERYIRENQ
ncbi:hypothetical protein MZD04_gp039 [Pseudomonas phage Psa21]|uniref:Uncharacterized protein n=1 Tax=Pseudomonas phage Psa21 TaxID=2530023 RepID=A0A481W487_9CAUD|nr:hypothetical protein MZD04_gp039 [Pseudomonas phage Psa21]QBJ02569.1 hypothetical protein PSA21_39 [Pseudomonas phage Psa21]